MADANVTRIDPNGAAPPRRAPREVRDLDALMAAAQAGDGAAYRALLVWVSSHLRGLVWVRAPYLSREDVEDIVQDVLLSMHVARNTWDPSRPFRPWLASIARNRMADHARRYGRRVVIALEIVDIDETFCDDATNNHADKVVNFLAVREAIRALPPSEKVAVNLLRLRQMTLAEAAEASGTSVAALKIAIHRATRRLRGLLSDGHGDRDSHPD